MFIPKRNRIEVYSYLFKEVRILIITYYGPLLSYK